MRPSRHNTYLEMAFTLSRRGTCSRRQVGAVIVRNNHICSGGYVGSPQGQPHCIDEGVGCLIGKDGGCLRTIHAEANAIAWAAKTGQATEGGEIYCTASPCLPCAKLIIAAGITSLYYLDGYRDNTGLELLFDNKLLITQMLR